MQQINLYQDEFRARGDLTDAGHMGLALIGLIVVLLFASVYLAWQADTAQAQVDRLTATRDQAATETAALRDHLETLRAQQAPDDGLAGLRAELAAKQRLVEYLENGPLADRDGFSAYLAALARDPVADLWLERIEFRAGGRSLSIAGHARKPEQVPAFLRRLAERKPFQGYAFRTLRIDRDQEYERLDFLLASKRKDKEAEQ